MDRNRNSLAQFTKFISLIVMEANCEQLPWQCQHSMDSGSQHSYVCLNNVLQRKLVSFSVPGLLGYFTTYADNRVITIGGNHLDSPLEQSM